jgi:O-antigen/teichoic acid export membrane protein
MSLRNLLRGRGFLSASALLFIALNLANISNYLYQVVMGRALGEANYGLLVSIVGLVNVIAPSLTFLQTSSAKAIAARTEVAQPLSHPGQDPLTRAALLAGLGLTVIFIAASPLLAVALQSSIGPPLVLAASIIPSAALALGQGRLQGIHALHLFAVLAISVAILRLTFGPIAVAMGTGVTGAGMALALAAAIGATWALYVTRKAGAVQVSAVRAELGRGATALVVFWIMVTADVVASRIFLPHSTAGQYNAASVVGKAVFWLPAAIAIAIYPRVARDRARGASTTSLLLRAMGLTVALCLFAVAALKVLGPTVIPAFYGHSYDAAARVAWEVGLAAVPFALGNLLVYYHLASSGFRIAVVVIVGALVEFAAFGLLHDTIDHLALAFGIGGVALCVGLLAIEFVWPSPDHELHPPPMLEGEFPDPAPAPA